MRGSRRAGARATCSLLLPRLLIAADDVLADLRRRVALALVGEIRLHRLMHHRHVDRAVEQLFGKRHFLARRSLRGIRGGLECRSVSHELCLLVHDDEATGRTGN
jgi:hypothetical protein